jgi:hypothetical protein
VKIVSLRRSYSFHINVADFSLTALAPLASSAALAPLVILGEPFPRDIG